MKDKGVKKGREDSLCMGGGTVSKRGGYGEAPSIVGTF